MTSGFGLQFSNSAKKGHAINDIFKGPMDWWYIHEHQLFNAVKDQGSTVPAQITKNGWPPMMWAKSQSSIPVGMRGCQTPSHIGQLPEFFGCVHLHGDELQFSRWQNFPHFERDICSDFLGCFADFPRKFGWFSPTFHWWPPNFCMAGRALWGLRRLQPWQLWRKRRTPTMCLGMYKGSELMSFLIEDFEFRDFLF